MDQKLAKLRWQCTRRSMAEADFLLGSFLDRYYDKLNGEQAVAFEALVAMEDLDLWALVSGRRPCADAVQTEIIEMLRTLKIG